MTVTISQKIIGVKVLKNNTPAEQPAAEKQVLHEKLKRPECLEGSTYKVSPPLGKALYVTINHYILNEGTDHATKVPFEIFVEGGEASQRQWVSLSTRLITSIWRKGGNAGFIVEDMKEILDPTGGYMIPNSKGKYANSIVAHIGFVLEDHLIKIGHLVKDGFSQEQMNILKESLAEKVGTNTPTEGNEFPPNAVVCQKCHTKAVVRLDGCDTCLQCSDTKCG